MSNLNDLVFPLLLLEPAALRDVVLQRSSLALEAKANLVGKSRGGFTHDVDMPATVFLRTPPAQDAKVEQQQLHLLAHDFPRSTEDDSTLSGVPVAVEVRAQERCYDFLGGAQNRGGHLFPGSARAVCETKRLY